MTEHRSTALCLKCGNAIRNAFQEARTFDTATLQRHAEDFTTKTAVLLCEQFDMRPSLPSW